MPALNFQPQFKKPILDQIKPGTIRQIRKKNQIRPHQWLHLFTGMRTVKCKKFLVQFSLRVYDIKIDWRTKEIYLEGVRLIPIIRRWFATTDICGTEQQFFDFFRRQNYQRPTVWIVWDLATARMIDEYLADMEKTQHS